MSYLNDDETPVEGTVIHATNRKQDVIPALLSAVSKYCKIEYAALHISPFAPVPAYAQEDEASEWWESEESDSLVNELFDILDSAAPDGMYFGSHEGDGSDLGFWKRQETEE